MNATIVVIILLNITIILYNLLNKNYDLLILYSIFTIPFSSKYIFQYCRSILEHCRISKKIRRTCQQIIYRDIRNIENQISEECCICLESFRLEETVVLLPCGCFQVFHKKCIYPWLERNLSCPACRDEF